MKIIPPSNRPYPNLRFRTYEDAQKVFKAIKLREQFDWSLCVAPFESIDGVSDINKEYMDATYELTLVEIEPEDKTIVTV